MKRQAYPIFTFIIILIAACQPASPEAQSASPSATEAADQTVSLNPASVEDVEIEAFNFFQDSFGRWRVVGLLANRSDQPVGAIALNIEYLDASGEVLAQDMEYSMAASIPPGQTAPFSSGSSEDLSAVGEVNITVVEAYLLDVVPVQLDLVSQRMQIRSDGIVLVTGEVANHSADTVVLERIAAALFSTPDEPLIAGESDAGPRMLAPGEQAPFRVILFGHPQASEAIEHRIYISAIRSEEVPSYAVTFLEGEHTYSNQLGQFHIVGEVQNSDTTALDIFLLCGLYDANGDLIDVVSYDVMPASLGPGEIAPFELVFLSPDPQTPLDPAAVSWTMHLDRRRTMAVDRASAELAALDGNVEYTAGQAVFTGQILNDSGEPIQMVLVVAGLRERTSGLLVATGRILLPVDLADGENIEYRVVVSLDAALDLSSLEPSLIVRGR